jgi:hypothetical protein
MSSLKIGESRFPSDQFTFGFFYCFGPTPVNLVCFPLEDDFLDPLPSPRTHRSNRHFDLDQVSTFYRFSFEATFIAF